MSKESKERKEVEDRFATKEEFESFLRKRTRIGLRRPKKDGAICRPSEKFPGIEEYIIIPEIEDGLLFAVGSLNAEDFEAAGIDIEAAWTDAAYNTAQDVSVTPALDLLEHLLNQVGENAAGRCDAEWLEELKGEAMIVPMAVVSNREGIMGAGAALFCRDAMEEYASKAGVNTWVLFPSSEHEFIAAPYLGEDCVSDYVNIMKAVDEDSGECARLIDKVYVEAF